LIGSKAVTAIEFQILPAQKNTPLNFYVTTAFRIAFHLTFRENGMISYYDGSNWHDFSTYSANRWYSIRLTDFTSDTCDIYVDDVLAVDNARMRRARSTTVGVMFETYPAYAGGIWYINSVKILYVA